MKKYLVGGDSNNKLFEISYMDRSGECVGTAYLKVIAKDILEAAEILISIHKVDPKDIDYINECKCESIIG